MKTIMNATSARRIAWFLVVLNLTLMGIGLTLQVITDSPFLGGSFLIHFSEATGLAGFAIVGALIVSRHPRHPVGWIWLLISISFGVDHFAWGYATYSYIVHPGSLPGAELAIVWIYNLGRGSFGMLGMTLLMLLFPTGRPLSRFWNIFAWIAVVNVAITIPVGALAPNPLGYFPFPTDLIPIRDSIRSAFSSPKSILTLLSLLFFLIAAFSLLLRLIRSRGIERQQLKWFGFAIAILLLAFPLIFFGGRMPGPGMSPVMVLGASFGVTATFGLSAASAIAIFRYRLWDIDIIIRRTLVYGLLSTLLALIYFSSILLLQRALQAMTGQGSTLAIVASTLFIAAIFTPLRHRIQGLIDRLFYRSKYDTEVVMAGFNAGLREEVDLEQIKNRLVGVVAETLQPESLSLWLQDKGKR